MNALATARAHLAKAREFLDAADVELSGELYNAATSNAVLAGINAKDAGTGRARSPTPAGCFDRPLYPPVAPLPVHTAAIRPRHGACAPSF